MLGIPYNAAIDMWSFGCILYELSVGYPLFPGEDEKEHMALMMEVKGIPPRSVLARATRRRVFFDDDYQPILVANSKGKIRQPNGKNLTTLMNNIDPDFVDFIDVSDLIQPTGCVLLTLNSFLEMHRVEVRSSNDSRSGLFPSLHLKGRKRAKMLKNN